VKYRNPDALWYCMLVSFTASYYECTSVTSVYVRTRVCNYHHPSHRKSTTTKALQFNSIYPVLVGDTV